jgi:hypothetical protein
MYGLFINNKVERFGIGIFFSFRRPSPITLTLPNIFTHYVSVENIII